MSDQRDHSPRRIYIRNHLYVIFEEMAHEIGCNIDYLINESMRVYARTHHHSSALDESALTPPTATAPPPLPQSARPPIVPVGNRVLYLWFNQQRYTIDQPRFVIGRGGPNHHCDLIIPDSNISRNHCVISFRNHEYHIRDLESTNGVEFQGIKVKQKRISEGDKFYLCDYPLIFTYEARKVLHSG